MRGKGRVVDPENIGPPAGLVDIAENRRRGACIVKPLASMIRPGSVTRRFFLSPPPPLPRRVGGDHIEENGRRIFRVGAGVSLIEGAADRGGL